jgi:hypothetical protein
MIVKRSSSVNADKILANAPEEFDTFAEVAEFIEDTNTILELTPRIYQGPISPTQNIWQDTNDGIMYMANVFNDSLQWFKI